MDIINNLEDRQVFHDTVKMCYSDLINSCKFLSDGDRKTMLDHFGVSCPFVTAIAVTILHEYGYKAVFTSGTASWSIKDEGRGLGDEATHYGYQYTPSLDPANSLPEVHCWVTFEGKEDGLAYIVDPLSSYQYENFVNSGAGDRWDEAKRLGVCNVWGIGDMVRRYTEDPLYSSIYVPAPDSFDQVGRNLVSLIASMSPSKMVLDKMAQSYRVTAESSKAVESATKLSLELYVSD